MNKPENEKPKQNATENDAESPVAASSDMNQPSVDPKVIAVELLISRILRIGVLVSLSMMGFGVFLGVIQKQDRSQPRKTAIPQQVMVDDAAPVAGTAPLSRDNVAAAESEADVASYDDQSSLPDMVPDFKLLPGRFIRFDALAWMTVGLLVLIATPVMRVAVSILLFLQMGDRMFALITLFVLVMLVISFFLGHA